jgi:uncharacterized protein YfdQ (DUF2303 family)
MDISKEVIQHLQEQAVSLATETLPPSHIPTVALPSSMSIHNLEKFMAQPRYYRAAFDTQNLDQFLKYIGQVATDQTSIYVNEKNMTATAIIDQGDPVEPLWGKHKASLGLVKSPAFEALLAHSADQNSGMSQQQMIDFIHDWEPNLQFIESLDDHASTISLTDATNRIRTLNMKRAHESEQRHRENGYQASAMEQLEINSRDGQSLPGGFIFTTVPYPHLPERNFICRFYAKGDDAIRLSYRITQLEYHLEEIGVEFCDLITTDEAVNAQRVLIGTMEYQ